MSSTCEPVCAVSVWELKARSSLAAEPMVRFTLPALVVPFVIEVEAVSVVAVGGGAGFDVAVGAGG